MVGTLTLPIIRMELVTNFHAWAFDAWVKDSKHNNRYPLMLIQSLIDMFFKHDTSNLITGVNTWLTRNDDAFDWERIMHDVLTVADNYLHLNSAVFDSRDNALVMLKNHIISADTKYALHIDIDVWCEQYIDLHLLDFQTIPPLKKSISEKERSHDLTSPSITELIESWDKCQLGKSIANNEKAVTLYIFSVTRDELEKQMNDEGLSKRIKLWTRDFFTGSEDYNSLFDLVSKEQPFSYFNYESVVRYKDSWLDKLDAINVDSKHLRLTPSGAHNMLSEEKGIFERRDVKVFIHYLEMNRLYFWSFFEELFLKLGGHKSSKECVDMSAKILGHLRKEKFINYQQVDDLASLQIAAAYHEAEKAKNEIEKRELKKQFQGHIEGKLCNMDLEFRTPEVVEAVSTVLMNRSLCRLHMKDIPDSYVDLENLLDVGFEKVRDLVYKMHNLRNNSGPVSSVVANAIPTTAHCMSDYSSSWLTLNAEFSKHDKCDDVVKVLLNSVYDCLSVMPPRDWLAYRNVKLAEKALTLCSEGFETVSETKEWIDRTRDQLSTLKMYLVWYRLADSTHDISSHVASLKHLTETERIEVHQKLLAWKTALNGELKRIDQDLLYQYTNSCEAMYSLRWSLVRCCESSDYGYFKTLVVRCTLLTTKLRHLLEHTLSRFAERNIYEPLRSSRRQVHVPVSKTPDRFKRLLQTPHNREFEDPNGRS
jgi:hypothetical protein